MKHGKILFITEEYSEKFYGVYTSMNHLEMIIKDNFEVKILAPNNTKKLWRYSGELKNKLEKLIPKVDVVHIHGIWQYPQYIAAKLAIRYNKPFIISPHGMLEPWVMNSRNIGLLKALKKNIYLKLIALSLFRKATTIHAVTEIEKENLKKYFPNTKIEIIPNGIELGTIDLHIADIKNIKPWKYILFVGRLHPIKGIELLIKAFKLINSNNEWKLKIVGPEEDKSYVRFLKNLARGDKRIEFIGEVWGKQKFTLYKGAWITVVPSYSETIGLVNLESAACYTPTITTYQTGLLQWEKGGNILINPNVNELVEALKKVMSWSLEERINRGETTRKFIEKNFSSEVVGKMWIKLYSKLIRRD